MKRTHMVTSLGMIMLPSMPWIYTTWLLLHLGKSTNNLGKISIEY